ncbi:MAG TPA: ABC transporter transmembrane domain-containing protein, partial [Terriglobales bacterium]
MMRRLLRYVAPYWLPLVAALILMAAASGLDGGVVVLVIPVVKKLLNPASGGGEIELVPARAPFLSHPIYLNRFVPAAFTHNVGSIIALALITFVVGKAASEYLGTYLINYVGYGAVTDLRNRLFAKLIRQSAAFFQRQSTGRLMSIAVNDIERIQTAASASLADAVQQGFTMIVFGAI